MPWARLPTKLQPKARASDYNTEEKIIDFADGRPCDKENV